MSYNHPPRPQSLPRIGELENDKTKVSKSPKTKSKDPPPLLLLQLNYGQTITGHVERTIWFLYLSQKIPGQFDTPLRLPGLDPSSVIFSVKLLKYSRMVTTTEIKGHKSLIKYIYILQTSLEVED